MKRYYIIVIILLSTLFFIIRNTSTLHFLLDLEKTPEQKSKAFLKKEMVHHRTVYKKLVNSKGAFVEFNPYDYSGLYIAKKALDSLKTVYGFIRIIEDDESEISEEQLNNHINASVKTWQNSKFSKHVSFQDFLNFMLPYRAGKEHLSNYKRQLLETFSNEFEGIENLNTPLEAVNKLNNAFKEKIMFDLRSHAQLNSPGVLEVLTQQKGSCIDITQFTAITMRTAGLAVAIDECPIWAHRNAGHQWNSFLNSDGNWVPFSGAEKNPDEFDSINDSVKAPKIFRHTFSSQPNFAPSVETKTDIPPLFRNNHRIDVTHEYVNTSNVTVKLKDSLIDNKIIYLAVFNAEKWKIVSWAKINNGIAKFKEMGNNNIVYLPVFYKNGITIPTSKPFLLTPTKKIIFSPKTLSNKFFNLKNYNKFFDSKWNIGKPQPGWKMELFYWNNKWVSCGIVKIADSKTLDYTIPQGGLYLIKSYNFKNTWQRVFSIENSEQVWY